MRPESNSKLRLALLGVGGLTGLLLAMFGLLIPTKPSSAVLPAEAVALVNGQSISRERFAALASDFSTDQKSPLETADYQFVLDRLIDEELLIDRGIELGLADSDPVVRKAIAAAVIGQIAAEAEAEVPEEADLRAFYKSDPEFFQRNSRYRVHWWRLSASAPQAAAAAEDLLQRLTLNKAINSSEPGLPQPEPLLPDQLLTAAKLSDYLGPQLARTVQEAAPGDWIGPVPLSDSFNVLHLAERQSEELPAFEEIRPLIEAEYRRRNGERALLEYLHWLRSRAEIVRIDELVD